MLNLKLGNGFPASRVMMMVVIRMVIIATDSDFALTLYQAPY